MCVPGGEESVRLPRALPAKARPEASDRSSAPPPAQLSLTTTSPPAPVSIDRHADVPTGSPSGPRHDHTSYLFGPAAAEVPAVSSSATSASASAAEATDPRV